MKVGHLDMARLLHTNRRDKFAGFSNKGLAKKEIDVTFTILVGIQVQVRHQIVGHGVVVMEEEGTKRPIQNHMTPNLRGEDLSTKTINRECAGVGNYLSANLENAANLSMNLKGMVHLIQEHINLADLFIPQVDTPLRQLIQKVVVFVIILLLVNVQEYSASISMQMRI